MIDIGYFMVDIVGSLSAIALSGSCCIFLPASILFGLITLINPKVGAFFLKKGSDNERRAKGVLIWGAIAVIFILVLITASVIYGQSGTYKDQLASQPSPTPTPIPTEKPSPTPRITPTPRPTPIPTAVTGYDLYKDLTTEQIKSQAIKVNFDDLMRNTDDYKDKLITIKANVVLDRDILGGYEYTCNINPNYVESLGTNTGTNNYSPQYVEFQYGAKLLSGDKIQIYGVVTGTNWEDYPIIKGVYCIRYT